MTLVVDAGPLVAAASRRDRNHARCVELLSSVEQPLLVPALVVSEVAYFLGTRIGPHAERAFAGSIRAGELHVESVEPGDWARIDELLAIYEGLGVVDASVVALCERLGASELATLDHRHFTAIRPRHCPALRLLP